MAVRARVKPAWSKWRELSSVITDIRMPRKLKVKLYETVVRPIILYGLETCALTRKEERLLVTTEMRMLRMIMGLTLRNRTSSVDIRKELGVCNIKVKARETVDCYGLVTLKELSEIQLRTKKSMTVECNCERGRPWMEKQH